MYNQVIPGQPIIAPTDYERAIGIKELCGKGLVHRLHLSQDICHKHEWKKYGGWSYDHILLNVVKLFAFLGISEKQFVTMMVDNPRAFFA